MTQNIIAAENVVDSSEGEQLHNEFVDIYAAVSKIYNYVDALLGDDISLFQKQQLMLIKGEGRKILQAIFADNKSEEAKPATNLFKDNRLVLDEIIAQVQQCFDAKTESAFINLNIYKNFDVMPFGINNSGLIKDVFTSMVSQSASMIDAGEIDIFIKAIPGNFNRGFIELNTVVNGRLVVNAAGKIPCTKEVDYLRSVHQDENGELKIKLTADNEISFTVLLCVNETNEIQCTAMPTNMKEGIGGKNCLVVDDSNQYARLLVELLTQANVNCTLARNGLEALEAVEQNDYDFIVMDLQMPVMGGLEAMAKIRGRADEKRNIQVLAITANLQDNIEEHCLEIGFSDFLKKPFHPDNLLKKLGGFFNSETNTAASLSVVELSSSDIISNDEISLGEHVEVDLSYLRSISKNDKEFEKDMIESSIAEIDEDLVEFSQGVLLNSKDLVCNCAHSIKSLCAIVGLNDLFQKFAVIEKQYLEPDPEPISTAYLNELKDKWEKGKAALEDISQLIHQQQVTESLSK